VELNISVSLKAYLLTRKAFGLRYRAIQPFFGSSTGRGLPTATMVVPILRV
jgi:hypothetical protein